MTSTNEYTVIIPVDAYKGMRFGSCTCGKPKTDGIPCRHMVVVAMSSKIDGLTRIHIMPYAILVDDSTLARPVPDGCELPDGHIAEYSENKCPSQLQVTLLSSMDGYKEEGTAQDARWMSVKRVCRI